MQKLVRSDNFSQLRLSQMIVHQKLFRSQLVPRITLFVRTALLIAFLWMIMIMSM